MLPVVGLLLLGVLVGRVGAVPDGTATALDRVVIVLALPGLVLARVPALDLTPTALVPVGVAWATFAALALVVALVARLAGWSRATTGTLLLCVPLGNTSFLGFPAVEALLGPQHLPYAIIYDQLGSFLLLATWGAVVAARYGAGARPTAASVGRRIVTFPPFVALVVAVAARWTGLPEPVEDIAGLLGATLTPLAMLAIGLRLRLPDLGSIPPLVTGLGLRMVAAPAAVLGVVAAAGVGGLAWEASVLESAMPPMVTAGVLAIDAGLDRRLAAALTGGGILLSVLTLPVAASMLA